MSAPLRLIVATLTPGPFGVTASMASYAASPYRSDPSYKKGGVDNLNANRDPSLHRAPARDVRADRIRRFGNVIVVRPHGRWYDGYGRYRTGNDAYKWLSFTAISLKLLDNLNGQQERKHAVARIEAVMPHVSRWRRYATRCRQTAPGSGNWSARSISTQPRSVAWPVNKVN